MNTFSGCNSKKLTGWDSVKSFPEKTTKCLRGLKGEQN